MARILGGSGSPDLASHESRYGRVDIGVCHRLVDEVEIAGLRGRGGAGFPTHVKMRAVRSNRRKGLRGKGAVVVANGTEGEPASAKDKVLLRVAPHLVLDGLALAAAAVDARRALVCVDRRDREAAGSLQRALGERNGRDPVAIEVASVPHRYVAGEETALVSWLNGGESRPTYSPPRPVERGIGGVPTLVDNVETLANVALIGRFGGRAWRQVGEPDEPGTMLVTLRGALRAPGVYEVPIGAGLGELLDAAGAAECSGVLIGGYFGTWLSPQAVGSASMSRSGLAPFGGSPGCGLVAALPADHCPLQEVSAVLSWLAANSAGQCGACVNGLPALAGAFGGLVAGDPGGDAEAQLDRWGPMVTGRGACKLPDGAVKFLNSARRTFAGHVELHRRSGPCHPNPQTVLPTPTLDGWR
jgi:NADH:ubiquinone oxidoreductase subunit F (NADH-binding)